MLLQIVIALFLITPCFGGGQFSSVDISSTNLQVGFHLNTLENSFSADTSTNGKHIVSVTGSPTVVTGYFGNGISFPGGNSDVIRTAISLTQFTFRNWTAQGWVKMNAGGLAGSGGCNTHRSFGACGVMITIGADTGGSRFGTSFGYLPDGNLFADKGSGAGGWTDFLWSTMTLGGVTGGVHFSSSPDALRENVWYNVAMICDSSGTIPPSGGKCVMYVNGSSVAEQNVNFASIEGSSFGSGDAIFLGKYGVTAGECNCILDDWAVWNSSQSASMIKNRYLNEAGRNNSEDDDN